MRYLSTYKLFESKEYLNNPSINWELIQTAKDIALDHLDEGLELEYYVEYYQPGTPTPGPFIVLGGAYSHDEDYMKWKEEHFGYEEVLKNENLVYNFYYNEVTKNNANQAIKRNYSDFKKLSEDLIDRLRKLYPDVNFDDEDY